MSVEIPEGITFNADGLVPAISQQHDTGEVLPYAPPLLARLDLDTRHPLARLGALGLEVGDPRLCLVPPLFKLLDPPLRLVLLLRQLVGARRPVGMGSARPVRMEWSEFGMLNPAGNY